MKHFHPNSIADTRFGNAARVFSPRFPLKSGFFVAFFKFQLAIMKFSPLAFSSLLALPVLAQEPAPTPTPSDESESETVIVVTAERNSQPLSDTPSSVSVITRQQIEAKKAFDIIDVLRLVPGVSIAQSGTRGRSTSIFTRGTNSNHTLVLVDGVRANSPLDGRFDFGQIPVENIERIEVVRGPGSALYGSDAIGGVINLITRRGDEPLKTGGSVEFGNRDTNRQTFSANGAFGANRLSVTAFRRDTDGQFQNDDFRDNGLALRFDRELSPSQNLAFLTRISKAKFGVPGQRRFNPDPFQRDETEDQNYSLQFSNRAKNRRDQIILGTYLRDLEDDDTRQATNPAARPSRFKNRVSTLDLQTTFDLGRNNLTLGAEERREKVDFLSVFGNSTSAFAGKTQTRAFFAQNEFKSGALTLVPSVRREDNSQFGDLTSYRLASAYALNPETRIKATYGTAFKAPSFSALYFPGSSNPSLEPERSKGGEIGISRQLDGGRVELTFFHNRINDLIDFPAPNFVPVNVARAKTRGVEIELEKSLGNGFRLLGNATTTRISSSTGPLTRRPKLNASADLLWKRGKFNTDLGFVLQGRRFDADFVSEFAPRRYNGFSRVDLTVGYQLKREVEIYARIGNLFNNKYEEVAGFEAQRFNFVLGVKTLSF